MSLVNIVGIVASIAGSLSLAPQAIRSIKTKQLGDISLQTYLLLVTAFFLWIIYSFLTSDIILLISTIINLIFGITILFLKLKHG